jgi:hypothetical protein
MNFKEMSNINYYIKLINRELNNAFSQEEIDFLVKCCDKKVDLIALEYHLRKKQKNNILSFIFLRLSSLAESIPQNQNMYVNKFRVSIFTILKVLLIAIFNLIFYELKRFTLANELNEYARCMK